MLVSQIVTDVQNHGFSDITSADILTHLNYAYQDINTLEAWPYLEKTVAGNFNTATAVQFSGVTDIKQILSLINTSQGYPLTPIRTDIFYQDYGSVLPVTGNPALYYVTGVNSAVPNGLAVGAWPIPAGTIAYQLRYLYIPATLTASDTPVFPERFHRLLTWGTLLSIYQMEDDTSSSVRFQGLYDRQLQRMRDDLWNQQFDRNDFIADVGSDYEWGYYT